MEKEPITVTISHLNHAGFGVAKHDNKQLWVLNALPGEVVTVEQTFRKKKGRRIATATEIVTPSPHRVPHKDEHFLSSSPWQILDFKEEQRIKSEMIAGVFAYECDQILDIPVSYNDQDYAYRNKMEYSFYSHDDDSLSFAFFRRSSHRGKIPHLGSSLAHPNINTEGLKILHWLQEKKIQARQLKSLILRTSFESGDTVAQLLIQDPHLSFDSTEIEVLLNDSLKGMRIDYSDRRSPTAVITDPLITVGTTDITEKILDTILTYPVHGFFQVNPLMFSKTATDLIRIIEAIPDHKEKHLVDMYSGVGTIGIILAPYVQNMTGVELFPEAKQYSELNVRQNDLANTQFIEASAEASLAYIDQADILIVDPPRSGLHPSVRKKICESKPKHFIYLSCNPLTQAKDWAEIGEYYTIVENQAYNYYPHTPHVEHLIVAIRK